MTKMSQERIAILENEMQEIMSRYAMAKACEQDRLDDRISQIEDELKVLRAP
jgi:hypothetical protein